MLVFYHNRESCSLVGSAQQNQGSLMLGMDALLWPETNDMASIAV